MAIQNKAIDAYIAKSTDFAKPILIHLRKLVQEACPEVEEKIKWGMPFFDYKGPLCNMASFKQHCSFGFWKAALMKDPVLVRTAESEVAMGHLGRITALKDLPSDSKIKAWIKEAMKLNELGLKVEKKKKVIDKPTVLPNDVATLLKKNKEAFKTYQAFSEAKKENILFGYKSPKRKLQESSVQIRPSNGWLREKAATGSIRTNKLI